jgi:hypothetical protein
MKWLLLIIILFSLLACVKKEGGYKIYTIEEGTHGDSLYVELLRESPSSFNVIFNKSCTYDIGDDQSDWNKLIGFSDCNDCHHENSVRIGWRWYQGKMQVCGYYYNNGERCWTEAIDVALHSEIYCGLRLEPDHYIVVIEDQVMIIPRTNSCETGVYYKLFPYFGGNRTAPHNINILIQEL